MQTAAAATAGSLPSPRRGGEMLQRWPLLSLCERGRWLASIPSGRRRPREPCSLAFDASHRTLSNLFEHLDAHIGLSSMAH